MMTTFLFQSSQSDLWWQESIVITRQKWRYRLRWRQWWQWWWQCFSFNRRSLTFEADSAAALLPTLQLQSCKIISIKDDIDNDNNFKMMQLLHLWISPDFVHHIFHANDLEWSPTCLKMIVSNTMWTILSMTVMMIRNRETDDVTVFSFPRRELPNYWPGIRLEGVSCIPVPIFAPLLTFST